MTRRTPWIPIIAMYLNLNLAVVGPFLAVALAGWGHGIYSPLCVSWAFLIGGAGLPVWWLLRRRRVGTVLALALLAHWLLADGLLAYWTSRETYHFERVWRLYADFIVAWFVMWLLSQACFLWLLISPHAEDRIGDGDTSSQRTNPP